MKVVLHVGVPEQWNVAVGNSRNLKAASPDATVEIVVNSTAINLFKPVSERTTKQLASLVDLDVKVKLCRNSIIHNEISESDLPKEVEVVPAGIVELIERQEEGFAYVSP